MKSITPFQNFRSLKELNFLLPISLGIILLLWLFELFHGLILNEQLLILIVLSLFTFVFTFYLLSQNRLLNEQQARFEVSVNNINIGFIITDTLGEVVSINPAAKRMLFIEGNTASPAILRNTSTRPTSLKPSFRLKDLVSQLKGVVDLEFQLRRCLIEKKTISIDNIAFKDLFLHIFMTPIVVLEENDLGLDFIGAVILIEDKTNQKIVERSKDEFFSIASHELKTPLGVIRSNAEMIRKYFGEKIGDRVVLEMIDDIYHSAVNLIGIVNDYLDVSRLEQGRIDYQSESFDLTDNIAQVVDEFEAIATAHNISLVFQKSPHALGAVYADPEKTKQILVNLISNAIKYTEQGQIKIAEKQEGKMIKVLVADTGRGIALPNQKLLFRKFQSASKSLLTRDTSLRSTGLGLYISKLLAEGMGGQIKLEYSEPNKGSVFSFTLPLTQSSQVITVKPYILPQTVSPI